MKPGSKYHSKQIHKNKTMDFIIKTFPFFGAAFFLIMVAVATGIYGDYDFFNQTLSELGVGNSAFYFNIGLIITGLVMIPFYWRFYSKTTMSKALSITGMISAVALAGVGIFPISNPEIHLLFASVFFVLSSVTIILYEINNYLTRKVNALCIGQVLIAMIIFSYVFIFRTPFMQKFAIFLIMLWIILTHIENNMQMKKFQLK